jgi:hypothetical protein
LMIVKNLRMLKIVKGKYALQWVQNFQTLLSKFSKVIILFASGVPQYF